MIADGDDALLPSLPSHLHLLRDEVEINAVDAPQLGEAEPSRIEELEDREVAYIGEASLPRTSLGHLEEQTDLRAIEVSREMLFHLRRADAARRVGFHHLGAVQELIERADGRQRARDRALAESRSR